MPIFSIGKNSYSDSPTAEALHQCRVHLLDLYFFKILYFWFCIFCYASFVQFEHIDFSICFPSCQATNLPRCLRFDCKLYLAFVHLCLIICAKWLGVKISKCSVFRRRHQRGVASQRCDKKSSKDRSCKAPYSVVSSVATVSSTWGFVSFPQWSLEL